MPLHKHWQSTRVVQAQARNPEWFLGQGARASSTSSSATLPHPWSWMATCSSHPSAWMGVRTSPTSISHSSGGLSEKRSQSGQTSAPKSCLCIVTSRSYPSNSGGTFACTQCLVGRPLNLPQCGPPRRGSMSQFSVAKKRWHKDECRFHPGGCSGVHR